MTRSALRNVLIVSALLVLLQCAHGPIAHAQFSGPPAPGSVAKSLTSWVQWAPAVVSLDAANASEKCEAKIRAALEQPTTMDFADIPLLDAINFLRDQHGIEIQLDTKALEEAGVGSDTPVTRSLKGISLRSALHLLLASFDLTYMVRDEVLLITTEQAASRRIELRMYDVSDLVEEDDDDGVEELAELLQSLLAPGDRSATVGVPAAAPAMQIMPFHHLFLVRASYPAQEELHRTLHDLQEKLKESE